MAAYPTPRSVERAATERSPLFASVVGLVSLCVIAQSVFAGLFIRENHEFNDTWVQVHAWDGRASILLAALATVIAFVKTRIRRDLVVGSAVMTVLLAGEAALGGMIDDSPWLTALHIPLALAILALSVWLPFRASRR